MVLPQPAVAMEADAQIEGLFSAFELVRAALPVVIILALLPLVWLFAHTYIERGITRLRPHAKHSTLADDRVLVDPADKPAGVDLAQQLHGHLQLGLDVHDGHFLPSFRKAR